MNNYFEGRALRGLGSFRQTVLLAAILSPCLVMSAQTTAGRLLGTVTDPTGAAVPQATVTVKNVENGFKRQVQSGSTGQYVVEALPVGTYQIEINAPGFQVQRFTNATISADGTLREDAQLTVGASSETVDVTSGTPLVDTSTSSMGEVLGTKQIQGLPLNGRIFSQLVQTVPGAVAAGPGNAAESASGVGAQTAITASVNGMPWGGTTYTLDGVSNMELLNAFMNVTPPLDAIQEVNVSTNGASATVGTYGGAQVNAVIKSGTNSFHGSAFEFYRGQNLNATRWEATTKAPFEANQFGASIGGPILKNRLFFFVDYQGTFVNNGKTYNLTVPTPLMLQGYFPTSQFAPIYDPSTGAAFPIVNTANGPAYQIPLGRFDPVAAKMVANNNIWPAATNPNSIASNFNANTTETDRLHTYDVKIDYQFKNGDRLFGRESYQHRDLAAPSPGTRFIQIDDVNSSPRDHNSVIGYDHTFNQNMINSFRFGFNRFYTTDHGNDFGTNENQLLGIPNSVYSAFPATSGIANFQAGNVATTGSQSWTNSRRVTNVYEWTDNLTRIFGTHTVVFGGNYRRLQASLTNGQQNQSGQFNFNADYTSSCVNQPNCSNPSGGYPFASFLLGLPSSISRGFVNSLPATRSNLWAIYAQDDWRVTPDFTVNVALRWDVITPAIDKANKQANFNLATGLLDLATSSNRTPNVNTYYGGVSPRIGFAYTPNRGRTAIRGAYGISHFPANYGGVGGALEENYPFFQQFTQTQTQQYTPFASISGVGLPGGLPGLTTPVVSNNTITPPPNTSVVSMPKNFQPNVAQAWNFGIEQQLTHNSSLSINYVGTKATHILRGRNINVATPGPGDLTSRRLEAAVAPQINNVQYQGSDGKSLYHALQVEARKSTSFGLEGRISYTWSHEMDNTSVWNPIVDSLNYQRGTNQAPDVPNNLIATAIYQLPFGRDRHFLAHANGITNATLGGWQLATTTVAQSGTPLTFNVAYDNLNAGFTNRASITCANPQPTHKTSQWFDVNCFTTPAAYEYGNSGTRVRGPAYINSDVTLSKTFNLHEKTNLQVQADAFNLTNTPHYANPSTQCCSTTNSTFGKITSTNGTPREIQLGAHLTF